MQGPQGRKGSIPPQFCIVKNKPARNYKFVEGVETFRVGFDDEGHFVDFAETVSAGDVAYWDGTQIKTTPLSSWTATMGTAIGVVVIPNNFLSDGKMRILSLSDVDSAGMETTESCCAWGPTGSTALPTQYNRVPNWNNDAASPSYVTTSQFGYLPSDNETEGGCEYTGATCTTDSTTKYSKADNLAPSSYLSNGSYNTAYSMTIAEGNNALSDFDGKTNTAALSSAYTAANACVKYSTVGTVEGDWYLPAAGEIGFIIPRLKIINESIAGVGGNLIMTLDYPQYYWSSSESSNKKAYNLATNTGLVSSDTKAYEFRTRPFLSI